MNRIRGFRVTLLGVILPVSVVFAQSDVANSESWTLKPYEANRDQFTLQIPETWHAVDQTPYRETGIVAFYSQPLVMRLDDDPVVREEQKRQMMALADDLMSGAAPAFFMDRYKAGKGMVCTGYSEQAQKKKLKIIANSPALGKGARPADQPDVAIVDFAGCKGMRVLMRISGPGSDDRNILVYTAASNDITYDFVLLTDAAYFDRNLPWFERVVATAKLTSAE